MCVCKGLGGHRCVCPGVQRSEGCPQWLCLCFSLSVTEQVTRPQSGSAHLPTSPVITPVLMTHCENHTCPDLLVSGSHLS